MNISLSQLIISKSVSRSPIISFSISTKRSSLGLSDSIFSKTFSNIIFSNSNSKFSIYTSTFKQTLDSAIAVNGKKIKYVDETFNNNISFLATLLEIESCLFQACSAVSGGAIKTNFSHIIILKTTFDQNTAENSGACSFLNSHQIEMKHIRFSYNAARYIGAAIANCFTDDKKMFTMRTNFTKNSAEMWCGAFRGDTGTHVTCCCNFFNNSALVGAAYFDFSHKPSNGTHFYNVYQGNNCTARGVVTCFHILQQIKFDSCFFVENTCRNKPNSIEIESINSVITLSECFFDGKREEEIGQKFKYSEFVCIDCIWEADQKLIASKIELQKNVL